MIGAELSWLGNLKARQACLLFVTLFAVNCRSSNDEIFEGQQRITTDPSNGSANGTPNPNPSGNPNSTVSSGFGDGSDNSSNNLGEDISYPVLSFTGRGNLDHRNGSANVVQKFSASMDKAKLTVNVQQFFSDGGDNKSDVNDEINKQTGDTVYTRVDGPQSTSNLTAANDPTFLVFSRSFEDHRSGKNRSFIVTSGDAMPVLVVPAAEARYEVLTTSSLSYRSTLSSNGQTFTVQSTISGRKISTGNYQVTIDLYIPEDKKGELYGIMPMSKTSEYGIDLGTKQISSIATRGTYNDKDSNKARAVNIAFQLCQSQKNGKVEQVSSCP